MWKRAGDAYKQWPPPPARARFGTVIAATAAAANACSQTQPIGCMNGQHGDQTVPGIRFESSRFGIDGWQPCTRLE